MFFIGLVAVMVLGGIKLYHLCCGIPARLVTDSPYFYISLTTMIIGTQLFLAGFVGELIARNSSLRNRYEIDEELNITKD